MTPNSAAVQVEPDSNGNITITIKLVIAAPGMNAPVSNVQEIVEAPEVNQTPRSDNLLDSSSDDDTTVCEEAQKAAALVALPYSLRSRIRVQDDVGNSNDDHEEYEIDYELSQQVSNVVRLDD